VSATSSDVAALLLLLLRVTTDDVNDVNDVWVKKKRLPPPPQKPPPVFLFSFSLIVDDALKNEETEGIGFAAGTTSVEFKADYDVVHDDLLVHDDAIAGDEKHPQEGNHHPLKLFRRLKCRLAVVLVVVVIIVVLVKKCLLFVVVVVCLLLKNTFVFVAAATKVIYFFSPSFVSPSLLARRTQRKLSLYIRTVCVCALFCGKFYLFFLMCFAQNFIFLVFFGHTFAASLSHHHAHDDGEKSFHAREKTQFEKKN